MKKLIITICIIVVVVVATLVGDRLFSLFAPEDLPVEGSLTVPKDDDKDPVTTPDGDEDPVDKDPVTIPDGDEDPITTPDGDKDPDENGGDPVVDDPPISDPKEPVNPPIEEDPPVEGILSALEGGGDDYRTLVVNQKYHLPEDYAPENIETLTGSHITAVSFVKDAIEELLQDARDAGHKMWVASGYRSYDKQLSLYNKKVDTYRDQYPDLSEEEVRAKAATVVTYPGTSEHQTGLAIDVTADGSLNQSFGNTDAGKWIADHCREYGFIIRYEKNKEDITGIIYEPWHLRYVGVEVANAIGDLSLEEYYNKMLD